MLPYHFPIHCLDCTQNVTLKHYSSTVNPEFYEKREDIYCSCFYSYRTNYNKHSGTQSNLHLFSVWFVCSSQMSHCVKIKAWNGLGSFYRL